MAEVYLAAAPTGRPVAVKVLRANAGADEACRREYRLASARTLAAVHALLAQLASGMHPFAGRSEQEWILRLQSAQPDLFGLPPGLDDLIRAALVREPRDRPAARDLPGPR